MGRGTKGLLQVARNRMGFCLLNFAEKRCSSRYGMLSTSIHSVNVGEKRSWRSPSFLAFPIAPRATARNLHVTSWTRRHAKAPFRPGKVLARADGKSIDSLTVNSGASFVSSQAPRIIAVCLYRRVSISRGASNAVIIANALHPISCYYSLLSHAQTAQLATTLTSCLTVRDILRTQKTCYPAVRAFVSRLRTMCLQERTIATAVTREARSAESTPHFRSHSYTCREHLLSRLSISVSLCAKKVLR